MTKFIHTADDEIVIGSSTYPLAFFLTQEAAYTLPAGADRQYYDDTTMLRIASDGSSQILTTSVTWTDGDGYIANKATYDAAYVDYVSYPDLATAKTTVKELINEFSFEKQLGHISYGGNDYDSAAYDRIHQFLDRYARRADISASFYLKDTSEVEHILTQDDLRLMANLIDDLHRLCDDNRDDHLDAVDLLGSVAAVKAYDYTTGWPTVPYS